MMVTGSADMGAQHNARSAPKKERISKTTSMTNGRRSGKPRRMAKSATNPVGYDPETVRTSMREAVRRSGKSLNKLAEGADLGANTLGAFLKEAPSTNAPRLDTAMAFAKACGVTLSQFVGEHSLDEPVTPTGESPAESAEQRRALLELRKRVAGMSEETEELLAVIARLIRDRNDA